MPEIDGYQFPDLTGWLPHADRLNFVGETLLGIAGAALEAVGRDDQYTRRVVAHGQKVPVEPSASGASGQLTLTCSRLFLGRPGEQRYQFDRGAVGAYAFRTAVFPLRITRPHPIRDGPAALPTDRLSETRTLLWTDGLVVWNALVAFALGGVRAEFWNPKADEIHVGPLTADDPLGGMASWEVEISVQI